MLKRVFQVARIVDNRNSFMMPKAESLPLKIAICNLLISYLIVSIDYDTPSPQWGECLKLFMMISIDFKKRCIIIMRFQHLYRPWLIFTQSLKNKKMKRKMIKKKA